MRRSLANARDDKNVVFMHSPEIDLPWNVVVQDSGQVFPCEASGSKSP
jgi:hypothetical protein